MVVEFTALILKNCIQLKCIFQTLVVDSCVFVPLRREHSKVPLIVRQCVEEIERRGMEEVGIYRVSGVATDIQALKAAFDASEYSSTSCTYNLQIKLDEIKLFLIKIQLINLLYYIFNIICIFEMAKNEYVL